MKLHLPARLRSALLACLAVVAPLAGTVATGTFVGGAVVASLSLTEAQAAEVEVAAGTTVTYDEANTYVLKGGTLKVESGAVSSAITVGAPDSTVSLGAGAVLSPLHVTLAEGVDSYKLVGTGTYDLASATQMYGANASSADWTGTVSISNSVGVGNFNINNYGNASSSVKLSGVAGWLALGVTFNPTLILEDTPDASALNQTDGSSNREYAFTGVKGKGTFERGGTKFSGAVSYAFTGDVSEWTGNFVNNFGQTTLIFRGNASEINLAGITHNAGYDMGVKFDGAVATTVNSPIRSTAGGAINMTINNTGGVTFNKSVEVATLTANAAMTVGSTGKVTVSGASTIAGALTINGTLSLNGGATLGASVNNNGTLNVSGELIVESAGLEQTPTGDTTFSDGDNGLIESGSIAYTVINNAEGAKLNQQGVSLSFDGDTSLKLSSAGTVVREADTSSTVYWVNQGDVSLDGTNATSYRMNGGTLVLDKTDAAAQGAALVSVEGGKGIVQIVADTTLTGQQISKATCDVIVSGATLKLGAGEAQATNVASFSSVTLEDNAALFIESQSSVINNLTVNETGARFDIKDTQGVPSSNPYRFSGVTTLKGTLTRVSNGGWGNGVMFEHLTGAGSLVYTNNPNEQSYIAINSLQGFTGDLSFTQTNNNAGAYEVLINSGEVEVAMNTLTVGCINKPVDFRNMSVELDASNGWAIQQLNIRSNTNLGVTGASGLAANVVIHGVDNLITVRGDSALNLAALDVTTNGVLTIAGNVSALAMNQVGTLELSEMKLIDGASLVYGSDAATLLISEANLLGKVKVDLNSLTEAQILAIADGSGLDLGIDAAVDKSLITVVADNVRNAQLKAVGNRWSIASGVVSLFWEAEGDGNWNSADSNWSFRDETEPDTSYYNGSDAIFSGDSGTVVTIADSVDVENIEVRSGKYTFATDYDGTLSLKNDLIIGQKAEATFNKKGASANALAVAGDVTVDKDAVLSVDLDSMSVGGSLSGAGKVNVNADLSLGASSSVGQLKVTGDIEMTGSTKDLTVGGASSAASLTNVNKLTVNKDGVMSVTSDTTLSSLAGEGALETANLTLNTGASSIAALKADSLTMSKDVTLDVGALDTPVVNMILGAAAVDGTPILTADSTATAAKVVLSVEKVDDLSKLTNGSRITIATIGTPGGDITGELQAPVIVPAGTTIVTTSSNSFSVTKDLRGFGYTLEVSDDNTTVSLVTGRDNAGWSGSEADVWTQGEQNGWPVGFIPSREENQERAAGFFGSGSSIVNIDAAGVEAALVDVDIEQSKLDEVSSYTFVGGSVVTDKMCIGQGELIIANRTEVDGEAEVYSNGKLTIAGGGYMEAYGNLSLTDDVALSLESDAGLTVSGTLSADKDVTITNNGMLIAHEAEVAGTIANEGTLQIGTGGTIGAIEGGVVRAMLSAPGTLKLGSANVSVLQIGTTGSTVELSGDSVIGTLYSTVEGTSLTSSAKLTLTEIASNQGGVVNVSAKSLTLNKIGNEFGALSAPEIVLDLKGDVLSSEVAALTVSSIVAVNPVQLVLPQVIIDGLALNADNELAAADYLLISGVSGHSVADFSVADSVLQEIRRRGVTAELQLRDDDLLLSLGAIPNGMVWNTEGGNMLTDNGYEVPSGKGLYTALDYVTQVLVSDNKTIDLTAEGVGDSVAGNASDPAVGLIVRNLDGGGKLTILGDAVNDKGELPDVATLIGNREVQNPVALVAESVKVNIGLPEGAQGVLTSDAESENVVLASAELSDNAILQVNADAEVKGQIDLVDSAALSVAQGKSISALQLNGDDTATVSGMVEVNGVGGNYEGSYGEAGAQVTIHQGAYQSIKAGKGLSLSVNGGEGTLDLAGADAEMSGLAVGSVARASRSELVIANVTMDDNARKVHHHKLSLTDDDSFISGSEVTASLGAEETAVTLGTDAAPVILDGKADVNGSTICLTMVTTNDNLRSLNVNTDAPMAGAKLATLVTGGNISSDNEVELIGSRAMMNIINKYYTNARLDANGDILVDRVTDYYATQAADFSETGTIGVDMLDKVLVSLNPQSNTDEYADLAGVLNALDDAIVAGNTAAADDLASAVTGASAAAMGAALAGDMERQLRAIRNRTTTMGVDQSVVNHNMPYFNAWINAEVDNRTLDQDGTLSGYDYTVTGGTVGFDVDITPRFVCGLAVSALTGDVSSKGPDKLDADVDSYYLTAFARATHRRWTHTFVASVGKSDLSMNRTVPFAGGSYTTKGETEATSFGAMYELGYVFALDVDGTTCLQPVFNVSFAHSSMDGYSESGSDAALEVGSVDMTTITVGMGARLQSVVGQNVFNRAAIFESRALVKVNAGDRDAEVDTTLQALPTAGGKVSSAERGPISLELGAGITIPVGAKSGSIFVDGSAELGSEYTGLNATVGYRLNF